MTGEDEAVCSSSLYLSSRTRHRDRRQGEKKMRFASLLAATAGLALSACAAQRQGMDSAPAFSSAASAEANTAAALRRIEALNPKVNAVIATDPTAMDQARALDASGRRGPLHGMPILIKDNIEVAGPLPTTAGSLALAAMSPTGTRRWWRG
jgi:amidase